MVISNSDLPKEPCYYISGPMSGIDAFNYPFFNQVATTLRNSGFTIFSPSEVDGGSPPVEYTEQASYKWYLYQSLRLLEEADAIIMLPGWWESKGARIEHDIARASGMPAFHLAYSERFSDEKHEYYSIGQLQ